MLPETQCYVARADISNEKPNLTIPLAKPRQNAKAVFKTYELFIYGDIYYIQTYFVKNVFINNAKYLNSYIRPTKFFRTCFYTFHHAH